MVFFKLEIEKTGASVELESRNQWNSICLRVKISGILVFLLVSIARNWIEKKESQEISKSICRYYKSEICYLYGTNEMLT